MQKLFDPYYQNDPTNNTTPAPVLARSNSGKFNGYSTLSAMEADNFPIDSKYWARFARGEWEALALITGAYYSQVANGIFPDGIEKEFSWRMICEMLECAVDQAKITPYDPPAIIAAAHAHLASKQITEEPPAPESETMQEESARIDKWLSDNWDLIPEVPYG